ncbi:hypothetical protein P171DRAFT_427393 [Karstenula rhodostoma CBS 690.94]|uniref:Uncharacterized protein n=1 Tax=Karstenula rhodostoma CBS 690.94 TaxID=1392251 RepID=A0A9P4PPU9_9PLEO|nr:hypothetical protein P171DRAFT_427393 [Karstenula rhodostoma CBS 690.94]
MGPAHRNAAQACAPPTAEMHDLPQPHTNCPPSRSPAPKQKPHHPTPLSLLTTTPRSTWTPTQTSSRAHHRATPKPTSPSR